MPQPCEFRDLGRDRLRRRVRHCSSELGGAAQARRDSGSTAVRRASARDHAWAATATRKICWRSPKLLRARRASSFIATDRGGDVTYHGPGPDRRLSDRRSARMEARRGAPMCARIEQVLIEALGRVRHRGRARARLHRRLGRTARKIAAIGVHISRWVTSHGFALNIDTDLELFPVHRSVRA